MTFARVLTPRTTFYPPNSKQHDDQIINGILKFINSSLNSNLQYIKTNSRTFVYATWNHIIFIVSGIEESVAYLRFRLQMIREIAVFLFGLDFDQIMRNNSISINYINLFAKYVDTFLEMSEENYQFQLGIISHDSFFSEYSLYLSKSIPTTQFPHDLPFIDCLVFNNQKIMSRFNLSNPSPIDYLSIFILAIFAKIEYPYINLLPLNNTKSADSAIKGKINSNYANEKDHQSNTSSNSNDDGDNQNIQLPSQIDNNNSNEVESSKSLVNSKQNVNNNYDDDLEENTKYFDPNYVNITDPASVQLRAGYLTINGTLQPISISSTRLGPNSPYVALFLTQELNASVKRFIVGGIISLISSTMSEALRLFPSPLSFSSPGLVYYLITNRTSGEAYEFETSADTKSHEITKLLFRTMKKRTFDALFNGQTTIIWRDSHFLFVYSIIFIKKDGKVVFPSDKTIIPIFKKDFNISYTNICNEFFHKEKKYRVFEVYSIFLSVIPPQVAYIETIKMMISILKKKKISFDGNIEYFQASIMPSNKK